MALIVGEKISQGLSNYISLYTNTDDIRDVCDIMDVSMETLRSVLRRDKKLTETSKKLVYDVLEKAIAKRQRLKPMLDLAHIEAGNIIKS